MKGYHNAKAVFLEYGIENLGLKKMSYFMFSLTFCKKKKKLAFKGFLQQNLCDEIKNFNNKKYTI